jgi:hypothetical protein
MGSRPAHSTRAAKARSRKPLSRRKSALPPGMATASAAAILDSVRQRLEVVEAVAAITSAALRSEVDCDPKAATTLQRCVCDAIDEQVRWLDWVLKTCRALARLPIDQEPLATDIRLARKGQESLP